MGATVWLPSEDEWYKAAYYDPTKAGVGGYWLYPTQSDSAPTVAAADGVGDVIVSGANVANYNSGADWNSQDGNVTTVGSAAANNYFGTFDQGGNVWEWNDAVLPYSSRGLRGGAWVSDEISMSSALRNDGGPTLENLVDVGFRIATVPEPTSLILTILASGVLVSCRKRHDHGTNL